MSVDVTKLPSGLTVITDTMPHLETAALGVWAGVGGRDERPNEHGISHLLEHMAFKGTTRRSSREIVEEIEAVGGDLNAGTSTETTAYYARVMKADVPLALDVLADILANPSFVPDELEREKSVIVQEIGAAQQGLHARQQLGQREGLGQVVVGAAVEPGDPILQLIEQPAAGERRWQELVDSAGGGVSVEHVAGWGTLVRADLPYEQPQHRPTHGSTPRSTGSGSAQHPDPTASPFTPREQQVAGLLADGLSDRSVAKALMISPKTVEKHVGALLRKTGTNSRTAAVMRALERGWLPPDSALRIARSG